MVAMGVGDQDMRHDLAAHRFEQRSSMRRIVGFFFSSRRRHTRSLCDWSSDVCSSDLRSLGSRRRTSAHSGSRQEKRYADRKSTRLNSSHTVISYAVFCLKKIKKKFSSILYKTKTFNNKTLYNSKK